MRAPRPWLSLLALTLLPGCRQIADTFFVVNAETQQQCITQHDVRISAVDSSSGKLTYTLEFPLGQVGGDLPVGQLDTEFRLRLFELTVTGGDADLSGLQFARVSLRRSGSQELIRTLVEAEQPSQEFSATRLTLRGVEPASVPQLGRDEQVELVFEARGTLPPQEWTADLQACGGLRSEVHYFNLVF
jgi:hypothetical protein